MRNVLIVHSRYATGDLSGENRVVEQQVQFLRAKGYNVQLVVRDSQVLSANFLYKLTASLKVTFKSFVDRQLLKDYKSIDIVILHNTFPNIGTRWLKNSSIPIIRFHHNYRDFCANGLLFRDGQSCTLCLDGKKRSAIIYGCYRDSRLASVPLFIASTRPLERRLEYSEPTIHVAVSPFHSRVMIQAGYAKETVSILRNYAENFSDTERNVEKNGKWLAVGRFEPGKGFLELVKEWPPSMQLDVIGEGGRYKECEDYITQNSLQNIRLLGYATPPKLREMLPSYIGAIIPGLTREPAPLVFPEFLSAGLPVIALANTSSGEVIRQELCGSVLNSISRNEITQAALTILREYETFIHCARRVYEMQYSAEVWSQEFEKILERAVLIKK